MVCILCFMLFYVFNVLLFSFIFYISVFIQRSFLLLSIFSYKKIKKLKKTATPQTQCAMPAMPCTKTLKLHRNSLAEAVAGTVP